MGEAGLILGQESPGKERATHSAFLPGELMDRETHGLQSMGLLSQTAGN